MKKYLLALVPLLFVGCSILESSKEINLIPFSQKGKYGYFDLKGKIVINPQFAFATAFRDDIALVKTTGDDGKWGYIDRSGKFIINPTYKDATTFQEDLAWVITENSPPSAIDKSGQVKFTLKAAEEVELFSEGLAAFSKADSSSVIWGFVDQSGIQAINPQFAQVGRFSDGKCAIQNKEGKWGYIDKAGKIAINYQFDLALNFADGKAVVYLDEKAGVIDEEGKYIINPQFKHAYADGENYLIYQDDKAGWCDKDGKFIINPQFEIASRFGDNRITCIKSGDKYGYIDTQGKFVINPQFDDASSFISDIAIVKSGDKYGLIDEKGKYIVNPQFEEIGYDTYAYIADFSYKNSISSDYLDTDKILKVINIDNPENLSLNEDFQTILRKINKTGDDFSAFSTTHTVFDDKKIDNSVSYGFGMLGRIKEFSSYNYNYYVTNQKPQGFIYAYSLSGKASGKAEIIQKTFEKKLSGYQLLKKGYVDGNYTSVYKSGKHIIITSNTDSDKPLFYILQKDFDISDYLKKIGDKRKEKGVSADDDVAVEAIDTTTAAVDSVATEYYE